MIGGCTPEDLEAPSRMIIPSITRTIACSFRPPVHSDPPVSLRQLPQRCLTTCTCATHPMIRVATPWSSRPAPALQAIRLPAPPATRYPESAREHICLGL